ncbi:MAG: hypothetical protein HY331_16460 [Chloroflexi bacterium]|nr:hypothetical protein [Chloroflexota bacterium]
MPRLPQLFIRTALGFFAAGILAGGTILFLKAFGVGVPYVFVVEHVHVLMVGFMVNMVMGVAYWMFPRPRGVRYDERLAMAGYWALNVGLVVRVVAEPADSFNLGAVFRWLLAPSAVAQVVGGAIFLLGIWRRIASVKTIVQAAERPAGQSSE